jgi:SAM-dependent methyltransferase
MKELGFEYRGQGGETVFETFLRYTNEKECSSRILSKLLKAPLTRRGASLLDVGSGNGRYLGLALNRMKVGHVVDLTLLEPSRDLFQLLREKMKQFPSRFRTTALQSRLERYHPSRQFDVILASHLPFPKGKLHGIYVTMLSWLKPRGTFIVVLRNRDDVHDFRTRFKSRLEGVRFQSLTINDAVEILSGFRGGERLNISTFHASSTLGIPVITNTQDTETIVEFLLNRKWVTIPVSIRRDVLAYLHEKNGVLHLNDGLALVKKGS